MVKAKRSNNYVTPTLWSTWRPIESLGMMAPLQPLAESA